jgi:hypothetical protein
MISDVQREVAVHLLANALRKRRLPAAESDALAGFGSHRRNQDGDYLRGMLDLLTVLYGRLVADELYREAQALERSTTHG